MAPLKIETVKNKYFLQQFRAFVEKEHATENFLFVFDPGNNQVLYDKYIKVGVPLEVNISDKQREPLTALATAKKWSAMSAPLKVARAEIAKLLNEGPLPRFKATEAGKRANFMLTLALDGPKATQMTGLLAVFEKPRTPEDKVAAHAAMQKLSPLAKLNPALRELGLEPPARVLPKKGDPTKALKLMGVPTKLVPAMTKLIAAYGAAASASDKQKALAEMDKIAKDIVKHDAIIAALKSSGLYE
jgi:hypothetical protein